MDMLVYRLNNCIGKDNHKERIEVLEELIALAHIRLSWEREYLREEELAKALEQIAIFNK